MRSRSVAVALLVCLGSGAGAVWAYGKASQLRSDGNWLMLRGNAQAEQYANSFDSEAAETQLQTFEQRRVVLEQAHFYQRVQMMLVLLSVVAAFSTYILWLYYRLRQQLVTAGEGLEDAGALPAHR